MGRDNSTNGSWGVRSFFAFFSHFIHPTSLLLAHDKMHSVLRSSTDIQWVRRWSFSCGRSRKWAYWSGTSEWVGFFAIPTFAASSSDRNADTDPSATSATSSVWDSGWVQLSSIADRNAEFSGTWVKLDSTCCWVLDGLRLAMIFKLVVSSL